MVSPKKNITTGNVLVEWFQNPWKTAISAIVGAGMFLGIGYNIGYSRSEMQHRMEKIEMQQEFNVKLQKSIDDCRDSKMKETEKSVEDLREFVKHIENDKGG